MSFRRRLPALVAIPLLVAQCAPTQCAPAPATVEEAWARVDADLSARLIGADSTAASLTVSIDGTPVHRAAYGARLPWTGEPTEPTDRFRVASISKVVTAIVVLQLVEAGVVGLDDAVGTAIAEEVEAAPVDGRFAGVTVRQLLSHTSGLGSFETLMFSGTVDSCPAAARQALSVRLGRAPGTGYTYSSLGYCLLGELIEHITRRDYEAVVEDQLLAPLGITGMRLAGTDTQPSDVFHWQKPNRNYMDVLEAAGSYVATSSDVVRIIDSLVSGTPGFHPLSPGTADLMRAWSPFQSRPDRWYGLGLICFTDGSWGHTGTLESAHAMVLHRADGVTWSLLVSGDFPKESDDLRAIFDDVVGRTGALSFYGR